MDQALTVLLPQGNQIQNILSRTHQKISQSKKENELEGAKSIMRACLEYLSTLVEYQGATAVASVNLDKFIVKCRVDNESSKLLLNLLHTKIDTTLWFRGKPAPFDNLVEMAQSSQDNQIMWEATRVISKIIDTPAWPILAQKSDGTASHLREVARVLVSRDSQSKWLDKLEDLVTSGAVEQRVPKSNYVIFDVLFEKNDKVFRSYLPSLVLWLASKYRVKSEEIVDELISRGGENFASLLSFSSGTKPSKTLDPVAQIIWWSEHLSRMKKVSKSTLEDVIERIEEVVDQNTELIKVFYRDYIHHHVVSIITLSTKFDDAINTELISFARQIDTKLANEIAQSVRAEFLKLLANDDATTHVIRKNSPSCIEVLDWALRNDCTEVDIVCNIETGFTIDKVSFGSSSWVLTLAQGRKMVEYIVKNLENIDAVKILSQIARKLPSLLEGVASFDLAEKLRVCPISAEIVDFLELANTILKFDSQLFVPLVEEGVEISAVLLPYVTGDIDLDKVVGMITQAKLPDNYWSKLDDFITRQTFTEEQTEKLFSLPRQIHLSLLKKLPKNDLYKQKFAELARFPEFSGRLIQLDSDLFFEVSSERSEKFNLPMLKHAPVIKCQEVLKDLDLTKILESSSFDEDQAETIAWAVYHLVEEKSDKISIELIKLILARYNGTLSVVDQYLFDAFRTGIIIWSFLASILNDCKIL